MKNFIKIFLAVVVMVTMFSFSSVQNSEAKTSEVAVLNSETQDFGLMFVKIVENGVDYIYIYTEGGIYITKVEEL
ncbi:MAG TPA: hypothetical protein PLD63_13530 [Ignavibacteria bacterium]|nr:hypothetical protein [Ignavibacteria bacterium]HQY53386.1 hypothetical protein [Ignavibacteria bacterium]